MRARRSWVCLSLLAPLAVGACGASQDDGTPGRERSAITEAVHAGGRTLEFKVGCAPELEVELVAESADAVVLSATHVPPPDGIYPACLEGYYVELSAPLGDRSLLDQDGDVIEVEEIAELEPSDAFTRVG